MGIFDFVKSVGQKLGFGDDDNEAATAEALKKELDSHKLGNDCLFRIGGTTRNDPTTSIRLRSGDVVILGGEGRLCFHGVDRIYPATSTLLKNGGRINLTLRRVTTPSAEITAS